MNQSYTLTINGSMMKQWMDILKHHMAR